MSNLILTTERTYLREFNNLDIEALTLLDVYNILLDYKVAAHNRDVPQVSGGTCSGNKSNS